MNSDYLFEKIEALFNESGFNIVSKVKTNDYHKNVTQREGLDEFLQCGKSIILIGFAGNEFWDTLRAFLRNNPDFKQSRIDWIDDYTQLIFKSAAEILEESGVSYEIIFPFGTTALDLDFMELGRISGVGVDSLLGILLHPEYGPWVSLRGAIHTDLVFSAYDSPLKNFTPCPPCPKPCITACPAKTISNRGWNWEVCMDYRLSSETCENNCASRRACPYGKEHQYTEEQLAHHHKFVLKSVKQYRAKKT
jgi:epoxyqueuosine reductase QueG